jgi:hypothetical protein
MIPEEYYIELSKHITFVDGKPYWNTYRSSTAIKGQLAGRLLENNYRIIRITINSNPKMILAHRLHWFQYYGYIPTEIDHLDHCRDNNHIENLREVTHSQNHFNKKNIKHGASKHRGVSRTKCKRRWRARIKIHGKEYNLGRFDKEVDAAKAYNEAIIKFNLTGYAIPNQV